jgi:hypothetical protein
LKRILFVPGKNLKPPPAAHRMLLMRCLLHGIRRIDPEVADEIVDQDAFSLVAWNYIYYRRHRVFGRDAPWVDQLLSRVRLVAEDVVARFLYQTADWLPWLIPLIPDKRIKSSIQETKRYFRNTDNIGCRIRELQKVPLREAARQGDKVLLIGHSMGSVIAFDALWELHHLEGITRCVDCFLTVGSPLGLKFVQHRLLCNGKEHPRRYPGNLRTWVNISALGDLVALDPSLQKDFGEMVTRHYVENIDDKHDGIYNHFRDEKGLNVHRSYGYLVNPVVDQVIVNWWRSA